MPLSLPQDGGHHHCGVTIERMAFVGFGQRQLVCHVCVIACDNRQASGSIRRMCAMAILEEHGDVYDLLRPAEMYAPTTASIMARAKWKYIGFLL